MAELANIRYHPALIVAGALGLVLIGEDWLTFSAPTALDNLIESAGEILVIAALIILVGAYGSFALARTTINPRAHSTAFVTGGFYRISRNPIYLGWFLFIFSLALEAHSIFCLLSAAMMVVLLHYEVVLKEEAYLERRFGAEYLAYKYRVRRWIGF